MPRMCPEDFGLSVSGWQPISLIGNLNQNWDSNSSRVANLLWKVKPVVSHLKVFGCVCYVFASDHQRSKFEKKGIRCIFVGYDDA